VYIKHYPQGPDAHAGSNAEKIFQQVIREYPEAAEVGPMYDQLDNEEAFHSSEPQSTAPYSMGIYFSNCQNLEIENVRVEMVNPPKGEYTSYMNDNI